MPVNKIKSILCLVVLMQSYVVDSAFMLLQKSNDLRQQMESKRLQTAKRTKLGVHARPGGLGCALNGGTSLRSA